MEDDEYGCEDCGFWELLEAPFRQDLRDWVLVEADRSPEDWANRPQWGACRRYPPTRPGAIRKMIWLKLDDELEPTDEKRPVDLHEDAWPVTKGSDWCGEFQLSNEPSPLTEMNPLTAEETELAKQLIVKSRQAPRS